MSRSRSDACELGFAGNLGTWELEPGNAEGVDRDRDRELRMG